MPERHDDRLVVAIILAAVLARLIGAAGAIDPVAGPDSGSYFDAARALSEHGLLSAAPNVPYWPAGYPTFLALVFDVAGTTVRVVSVAQILLFAVASWSFYALVRRELGVAPAFVGLVLLSASPALAAATSELMYETVLGAGLVITADLISRARRAPWRVGVGLATAGGLILGAVATTQPKALILVPWAVIWAFSSRRAVHLGVAVLVGAAVGPLALALRTQDTSGHLALSANLGATARIGLNDRASGGYRYEAQTLQGCNLPHRLMSRDRVNFSDDDFFIFDSKLTACARHWAVHHPARTAWLGVKKALYFWSPMVGPTIRQREATWVQPFDVRRLVPAGVRTTSAFTLLADVVFNVWTAVVLGLVLAGVLLAWRSGRRTSTIALLTPVLCFMAVSMITIGDARFRLPVAPFYIAFQGVALAALMHHCSAALARRVDA